MHGRGAWVRKFQSFRSDDRIQRPNQTSDSDPAPIFDSDLHRQIRNLSIFRKKKKHILHAAVHGRDAWIRKFEAFRHENGFEGRIWLQIRIRRQILIQIRVINSKMVRSTLPIRATWLVLLTRDRG